MSERLTRSQLNYNKAGDDVEKVAKMSENNDIPVHKGAPLQRLDNCPFCGGAAERHAIVNGYLIRCANRGCKVQPYTMATSNASTCVAFWNDRPGIK